MTNDLQRNRPSVTSRQCGRLENELTYTSGELVIALLALTLIIVACVMFLRLGFYG